mmetsp:Transcript_39299/g.77318  ORF Transcript_39299/g.77318 Transcript_39299/m.77318 type:complete len:118 (+) Transcript_39299:137-490(+)
MIHVLHAPPASFRTKRNKRRREEKTDEEENSGNQNEKEKSEREKRVRKGRRGGCCQIVKQPEPNSQRATDASRFLFLYSICPFSRLDLFFPPLQSTGPFPSPSVSVWFLDTDSVGWE